jgi:hypothetical protein
MRRAQEESRVALCTEKKQAGAMHEKRRLALRTIKKKTG